MIHDIDFKFDPKFDSPTDDIIEKLLLSKAEADSCRTRIVISYKVGDRKYTYEVRDFPKTEAGKRKVIVPDDFIPYLI